MMLTCPGVDLWQERPIHTPQPKLPCHAKKLLVESNVYSSELDARDQLRKKEGYGECLQFAPTQSVWARALTGLRVLLVPARRWRIQRAQCLWLGRTRCTMMSRLLGCTATGGLRAIEAE